MGQKCRTFFSGKMTQKEAVLHAVKEAGLGQKAEIDRHLLAGRKAGYDMLRRRLELLHKEQTMRIRCVIEKRPQ